MINEFSILLGNEPVNKQDFTINVSDNVKKSSLFYFLINHKFFSIISLLLEIFLLPQFSFIYWFLFFDLSFLITLDR